MVQLTFQNSWDQVEARLLLRASQVALVVKTRLPMQETQEAWVRSLSQEDVLEEGAVTHSSILA